MSMGTNRIMVAARPALLPEQAGPLVSDSFDRANANTLGTADTGQEWATLGTVTWGIATNKAYLTTSTSGAAYIESGASDVDITCDITHGADNGVAFRILDNSNYMMARLGANKVELYRRQAGAWNLLSEVAMTLTSGQTYAFRVVASGSTIDVYVDGVKKITATDSFQSTLTKHGLYGYYLNDPRWDNFKVEAVPPLVTDSFDRADSATSLGTADTGQVWSALAGTWGIETNRAYSSPATPIDRQAAIESSAADVTVEVTVPVVAVAGNSSPGLLGRVVDGSNYWLWVWEPGGPRMGLYKRSAGSYTLVGTYPLSSFPDGSRIGLRMTGSTIVGLLDGAGVLTVTDSAHQTATKHGLRVYDSDGQRFDNFRVGAA